MPPQPAVVGHANVSTAPPPFNNIAADTIIRSRDGVNFRVRSGIIAEASPIFADMFELPLPQHMALDNSPDFMDGKPVVAVQEDSTTLDCLLRLCYPVKDPDLPELRDVRPVLAAALKYEMEEAITLMKTALLGFTQSQPLAVWASACMLGLEEEAKVAATALIGTNLPPSGTPELQDVTAGMYYRLVKFLRARGQVSPQFRFCESDPGDVPQPKRLYRPPTTIAFQTRPYSDIICRSSDGQEFHTHRIILYTAIASPALLDRLLAASAETAGSPPVLDLDIRGGPLGSLLELCYPIEYNNLGHLEVHNAIDLMDAARQLRMDILSKRLRYSAMSAISVTHPLASYLLASSLGLTDIAEDALSFLHADPFTYGCIPEMETTPALPYHRLLMNRRESLAVASMMTSTPKVAPAVASNDGSLNTSSLSAADTSTTLVSGLVDDLPTKGDPWLLGILESTVKELRSPHQDQIWWTRPQTTKTLEQSVDRKLWCESCEENVQLIIRIEKLYVDVRRAMDRNNRKLLSRKW